jgi:hypothetical protein
MAASKKLIERVKSVLMAGFPEAGIEGFPEAAIDVSRGYHDNVHIIVFSRRFDDMDEQEKLDYLWKFIKKSNLKEEEKLKISLLRPYSPAELK